jgi:hypothetical protein
VGVSPTPTLAGRRPDSRRDGGATKRAQRFCALTKIGGAAPYGEATLHSPCRCPPAITGSRSREGKARLCSTVCAAGPTSIRFGPQTLQDGEAEIIAARLREILRGSAGRITDTTTPGS